MSRNFNLFDCRHCEGEGTCKNGVDGRSCVVCARRAELRSWKLVGRKVYFESFTGLVCGCCGGLGQTDLMTERVNNRITPALAILIPVTLLAITIFTAFLSSDIFHSFFTFSTTIIATIVSFYFSQNSPKKDKS